MELKCLGTGSKGNCYLLKSGNDVLILDCGIAFDKIIVDDFIGDIHNIKACLITHCHKDHNLAEKQMKLSGIRVISYNNINQKRYYIGNFEIMPFSVYHDVKCYAFLIRDLRTHKIVCYATDTFKLPIIRGVDYWLVECNFCEEELQKRLSYDMANYTLIERLRRTHMGDEFLVDYFKTNKIEPNYVLLLHRSNSGHYNSELVINKLSKLCRFVEDIKKDNIYRLGVVNREQFESSESDRMEE
jgi:hypothetical protein